MWFIIEIAHCTSIRKITVFKLITFLFQRHFHTHTKLLKSMGAFGGSLNTQILRHTTGAPKYTAKSLAAVKEELESTLHGL